jgi:peptidoglycan/LPS O-acetylase OafA/YrhL
VSGLTSVEQGAMLSHPRPEILALTGLRGLAAVGVVASQVGVWRTAPTYLHDLVAAASLGVPFFFLLSGFLLAYNYPSLTMWSGRRELGRYAMARVARLAPLFVVVGLGVLILGGIDGGDWIQTVFGSEAWFVGTALLLYCAYPLLARVVATSPATSLLVAFALQLVVLGLRLTIGSDAWLYRNPLVWLPDLVIGMIVAGRATRTAYSPQRPTTRAAYWVHRLTTTRGAYVVQAGAVVYALAVIALFGSSTAAQYSALWSVPLALVILTVAATPDSWTSLLLSTHVMIRLGVISYALFLLHAVVVHGFGPVHAGTVANGLLALAWIALAILVAEGAHRYIGAPARRALMNYARQLDDRRTASAESVGPGA